MGFVRALLMSSGVDGPFYPEAPLGFADRRPSFLRILTFLVDILPLSA